MSDNFLVALWLIGVAVVAGAWVAVLKSQDAVLEDNPQVVLALLWPLVVVGGGIYWLTLREIQRHRARVAVRSQESAERARLLKEAGFDP